MYPEVGVYVSISEATGQCHVSCEPESIVSVRKICFLCFVLDLIVYSDNL